MRSDEGVLKLCGTVPKDDLYIYRDSDGPFDVFTMKNLAASPVRCPLLVIYDIEQWVFENGHGKYQYFGSGNICLDTVATQNVFIDETKKLSRLVNVGVRRGC